MNKVRLPPLCLPFTPVLSSLRSRSLFDGVSTDAPNKQLSTQLNDLANTPTAEMLDGLRMLERKTSLVFTALKASVYSIVLQQEVYGDTGGGGGEEEGERER